jgi:hypothetical protein
MREMTWTDDGRQRARFRRDVGRDERRRLFRVCRPAWTALVAFSRRMNALVRRTLDRATQADRDAARAALADARLLLDDLTSRNGDACLEDGARLDEVTGRLDAQR